MKMISGKKSLSTLRIIKDYNGNPFLTDQERKWFIRNHYAEIYKKDPNEPDSLAGALIDFWGHKF
jgi:hypothetical protein